MKKNNKTLKTKISKNFQTFVPVEIQKRLKLKPSEELEWKVNDKGDVYLNKAKTPLETIRSLYGIAGDFYKKNYGSSEKYLKKERESWD